MNESTETQQGRETPTTDPDVFVLVEYEEYGEWRIVGAFSTLEAATSAAPSNASGLRAGAEGDTYGEWGGAGDPLERYAASGFYQEIRPLRMNQPT